MKHDEITGAAARLTREQFTDEISSYLRLTQAEVDDLFPKQSDREELEALVEIVVNSADEAKRKAKFVARIDKVAGAAMKLISKAVISP